MFVRNFFTKAIAEETGSFTFFTGSVLGTEAYFRAHHDWNNFFYLKVVETNMCNEPYLRVKCFPSHNGFFIREVELYNPESGLYEPVYPLNDKDRDFLRHIIKTCFAVSVRAAIKWRNSEDYFPF